MPLITNITKKNNLPKNSRNCVVLHYANCPDGVCAADLIQKVFLQALAIPMQPKFQMNSFLRNILINKQVFIVDLAVDLEVIQEICNIANYVVFIDHHERDWEFTEVKHDEFFYYYDTHVAACQLTFNMLNMKYHFSEVVTHYIDIINRYDLHQELADDEHHLIEGWISVCRTNKTPLIPEILDNCYRTYLKEDYDECSHPAEKLKYHDPSPAKIEINKFGIYVQSEGKRVLEERKTKYDYLCKSLKITSSWRSKSANLIPIVTKYGGGGHMNACGLLLNDELLHNLGFVRQHIPINLKHHEATNYTFFIFMIVFLISYLYENICNKI